MFISNPELGSWRCLPRCRRICKTVGPAADLSPIMSIIFLSKFEREKSSECTYVGETRAIAHHITPAYLDSVNKKSVKKTLFLLTSERTKLPLETSIFYIMI